MKRISMIIAAALLWTAAPPTSAQTEEDLDAKYATTLVQPGTPAPDFTLKSLEGKTHTLQSFKGKVVVLDFWASWCPDCRKDAPDVVRLYKQYHPKGVEFVGISFDTEAQEWKQAIEKYGIEYLQVSELKGFKESDIAKAYGIHWIPSLIVIGKDGKVLLSTVHTHKVDTFLKTLTAPTN